MSPTVADATPATTTDVPSQPPVAREPSNTPPGITVHAPAVAFAREGGNWSVRLLLTVANDTDTPERFDLAQLEALVNDAPLRQQSGGTVLAGVRVIASQRRITSPMTWEFDGHEQPRAVTVTYGPATARSFTQSVPVTRVSTGGATVTVESPAVAFRAHGGEWIVRATVTLSNGTRAPIIGSAEFFEARGADETLISAPDWASLTGWSVLAPEQTMSGVLAWRYRGTSAPAQVTVKYRPIGAQAFAETVPVRTIAAPPSLALDSGTPPL